MNSSGAGERDVMLPTPMRAKKLLTILSLLLMLLLAALVTYAYARRAKPILFRIVNHADPVKTPSILILNPFRDRGAEGAATAFLEKLKVGQCQQAVENLYAEDAAYRPLCATIRSI